MANADSSGTLCQLSTITSSRSPDDIRRALLVDRSYEWDRYEGRLEDFVAAGLFRLDELPGRPGRRKTACHYGVDGMPVISKWRARHPGGRSIQLKSKSRAIAYVAISDHEKEHRVCEIETRRVEATVAKDRQLIETMLETARRDIALSDHQLASKYRDQLRARIREHEEDLRALRQATKPKPPNLRLVHSANKGMS